MRRIEYIQAIATILFALVILYLFIFDGVGEQAQKIVLPIAIVGFAVWVVGSRLRRADEVQVAGVRSSWALGAGIGVLLAFVCVLTMRYTPAVGDLITNLAAFSNNGLSPAAVGFGFGVCFTIVLVGLSSVAAHALWWMARR